MENTNVARVTEQSKQAKQIFADFLHSLPSDAERTKFLASFHLRPTSGDEITVVSTLKSAPMRGKDYKLDKLAACLVKLREILIASVGTDMSEILKNDLGFKKRGSESEREENAQAALIRNVIEHKFDGFSFVASEFALFEVGDEKETKRPDVFLYKDGTLYDVELKNERLTATIIQAKLYVDHMKVNSNFIKYIECLRTFPNNNIGEIKDIRGVALVPASDSGNTSGKMERTAKECGIELWTFDRKDNYRIDKASI